jgi:hypothetical protein
MRTVLGVIIGLVLVGVGSFMMATGYDSRYRPPEPYPIPAISSIERK